MSQAQEDAPFKIHHEKISGDGWTWKCFEDQNQFYTTLDIIKGKDVDYEAYTPDGKTDGGATTESSDGVEAEVVDHTESAADKMDSGDSDHSDDSNDSDAQSAAVVETVQDEPPERNLSDDPVEWFGDIGEFTYTKNGTTAINKKGLRVLQYWYDIGNPDSEVVVGPEETDHEFARVRAEAEMPDGRTAVAHGSAHVDRGDDPWLLTEMADTRAKSRVILDITGMGAVAVSELENEL